MAGDGGGDKSLTESFLLPSEWWEGEEGKKKN